MDVVGIVEGSRSWSVVMGGGELRLCLVRVFRSSACRYLEWCSRSEI